MNILRFSEFLNENKEEALYTCTVHLDMSVIKAARVKKIFRLNDVKVVDNKSGAVSDSENWTLLGEKDDTKAALSEIGYDSDEVKFKVSTK